DLKTIYRAVSRENAEQQLEVFAAKWDLKYRSISQLWRRHWEQIVPFFAFPADIRKVIYTTNAVESLNMTLRKAIKTRGSFPNEEAAIKLLYLALLNVAPKWHTIQGWPQALNHFAILWGERFPQRAKYTNHANRFTHICLDHHSGAKNRPLSRFPLRGKAGAGGFPPRG